MCLFVIASVLGSIEHWRWAVCGDACRHTKTCCPLCARMGNEETECPVAAKVSWETGSPRLNCNTCVDTPIDDWPGWALRPVRSDWRQRAHAELAFLEELYCDLCGFDIMDGEI